MGRRPSNQSDDAPEEATRVSATGNDAAVPPLAVHLFGPFEARLHGAPLPRVRFRRGHWLLALLILRQGLEVERDWLAGTLWPRSPLSQGLASLRNCLKDLRRTLGSEAGRLYSPRPDTLALDLSGAHADVLAFDAAVAQGDPPALEHAVSLYRGPLLEGCVEEWAFAERQSREQRYLEALETLAARALAAGELSAAERYLRLATAVDPMKESAQRGLMQVLAANDDPAAALQVYRDLRQCLQRELAVDPEPKTRALFQEIEALSRRSVGPPGILPPDALSNVASAASASDPCTHRPGVPRPGLPIPPTPARRPAERADGGGRVASANGGAPGHPDRSRGIR
jgi:DNA-binding SARP family transcriptional activator